MAVSISLQFDGGEATWNKAIETALDGVKDFRPLWRRIVRWFEGNANEYGKSPIIDIWDTRGGAIGADWTNSPAYEERKSRIWSDARVYQTPIIGKWEQVLSGLQLSGLLSDKAPNAVREYGNFALIYGVSTEYSETQQKKKKILDISKYMDGGLNRILARWVSELMRGVDSANS